MGIANETVMLPQTVLVATCDACKQKLQIPLGCTAEWVIDHEHWLRAPVFQVGEYYTKLICNNCLSGLFT